MFKAVPLTDRVYWVGAIDWNIRDFHGYRTKRGSSYNAYLIKAEKPILIDTVKGPFYDELMARIASIMDPRQIKIVISLHAEMDHSGCLPAVVRAVQPETVYASVMGAKALKEIFHGAVDVRPLKDGESLSLGDVGLSFMETRMLHWPDSMIAYLSGEGILFSQDAFGMHLATSQRFADAIEASVLHQEGATYFANILMPYAGLVTKLLERVAATGWQINLVAPDHGPVWRRDIETLIARYSRWAARTTERKAVVVYGTM
ncbi:MAG: FprA family A-type flavoprotein, partial [Syntrophales bacterium]|nr:FprA family A-type flavoprotein [Syntrophales bacterium]